MTKKIELSSTIHLLGEILGSVIKKQENTAIFDKIEKIYPRIKHLFRVNKDGTLTCLHAEEERAEQKANRDKRIAAGKKGVEKRWDASAKKK